MCPYGISKWCIGLNRKRLHIVLLFLCSLTFWFSSCKHGHICPAYQSAFYLDHKLADIEFSPFDKDSMPRMEETVRKTDVLLVLRLGKKKIDKRMAVIPMITIFPEQADSALAMADSMASDSTMVEEENEQENDENQISDSTETMEEPAAEELEAEEKQEKKKEDALTKQKKKIDLKDPELSDPTMKAEFEEDFGDEPSAVDLNAILPEEGATEEPIVQKPVKKKKGPKKKERKDEPAKKEEGPSGEDDKF